MNRWQKAALGIAMALWTLACDESSEESGSPRASDVKQERTQEMKDAIETTRQEVVDRRRALEKQASGALQQIDRSIEEARVRSERAAQEVQARIESAIEDARAARRDIHQELEQLGEQGAATWQDSRQRLADALREAEEAQREIAAALSGSGEAAGKP